MTISRKFRLPIVVLLQLGLILVANYGAFWLRFDGDIPYAFFLIFKSALLLVVLVRVATFIPFRLFEGLWRYTSIWDLRNIVTASLLSGGVYYATIRFGVGLSYPRSIPLIDSLLLIFFMSGVRLSRRIFRDLRRINSSDTILIYGAGDAGEMVVRDMKNNTYFDKRPVGFIDDDIQKVGSQIHGVPVLGTRADLASIMAHVRPKEVLIAMPSAPSHAIRSIFTVLEPFNVPIKTLPNLRNILAGKGVASQTRSLALEDLLPRIPVDFDQAPVISLIRGKRVFVTGAGGSIGSELCRQITAMAPAQVVLFERHENSLFAIKQELQSAAADVVPVVGDVADRGSVRSALVDYRPDIIFHAAAHKHVPLMEYRPSEAVKNNITGTRILAEEAVKSGVERFILISSDKAADPSSVMGATKRVAELVVQAMAAAGVTRFSAVRFGNVLGSSGSVVPLFLEQIKRGVPLTVTHAEVRRYFMLIPEAVQLVLQTAAIGENGAIYVLEMGEQFKIVDLARSLIRLSGYVPDRDVRIEFIGLRPGEKLSETLVGEGETLETVLAGKIWRIHSDHALTATGPSLVSQVSSIQEVAKLGTTAEVIASLAQLVPTLHSPHISPGKTMVATGS